MNNIKKNIEVYLLTTKGFKVQLITGINIMCIKNQKTTWFSGEVPESYNRQKKNLFVKGIETMDKTLASRFHFLGR